MKKANNIIRIPSSINGKFFNYWFEFLRPFHNLTSREIQVAACLVKHRYHLSKAIKDTTLLDKVALSEDIKKQVRNECNVSTPHFQVIMNKLRKSKVIVDNKINPKFIPNIEEGSRYFQLMLLFELKDDISGNNQ